MSTPISSNSPINPKNLSQLFDKTQLDNPKSEDKKLVRGGCMKGAWIALKLAAGHLFGRHKEGDKNIVECFFNKVSEAKTIGEFSDLAAAISWLPGKRLHASAAGLSAKYKEERVTIQVMLKVAIKNSLTASTVKGLKEIEDAFNFPHGELELKVPEQKPSVIEEKTIKKEFILGNVDERYKNPNSMVTLQSGVVSMLQSILENTEEGMLLELGRPEIRQKLFKTLSWQDGLLTLEYLYTKKDVSEEKKTACLNNFIEATGTRTKEEQVACGQYCQGQSIDIENNDLKPLRELYSELRPRLAPLLETK